MSLTCGSASSDASDRTAQDGRWRVRLSDHAAPKDRIKSPDGSGTALISTGSDALIGGTFEP